MKYAAAKELGEAMGLDQPAEFVNNVALHKMNLFVSEETDECSCEYPHFHDYSLEDTMERCTCKPDCFHINPVIPEETDGN